MESKKIEGQENIVGGEYQKLSKSFRIGQLVLHRKGIYILRITSPYLQKKQ